MHCHRNKDRSAPFVGKSETSAQDEQRCGGRQMRVRRGEEKGIQNQSNRETEITAKHPIDEKSENEFLRYRSHHHSQNNNCNPFLERLRVVKKIDNLLLARFASQNAWGQHFGQGD